MRASNVKLFITGLILTLAFQPLASAQSTASFDEERLNTYLNKLAEENKFMGSVAIDLAGKEVYNKSLGFIHLDDQSGGTFLFKRK